MIKPGSFVFKSFSSGSCGNCYLLHNGVHGILIDAGVSVRTLKSELLKEGLGVDSLLAVLVTHDHMDHIRNLGSFCKRLGIPVWMTPTLSTSLATHWVSGGWLKNVLHKLQEGVNGIVPGSVSARYFVVPHDASETVGYSIDFDGRNFVIMTDVGRMTDEALALAGKAETVVVEANYDLEMLLNGPYPQLLKDRIRSGNGHLSNDECAAAVKAFLHPGLRNVFLCHLSENNNTPQAALDAVSKVLDGSGVRLIALPRRSPSPLYFL